MLEVRNLPRAALPQPAPSPTELIETTIDSQRGGMVWRRAFPGTLDQIPHARHMVRFLLGDCPRRDDAELIASELAGNAVRHTWSGHDQGTFVVEVSRTGQVVTVAVYDRGRGGTPRFGTRCEAVAEFGRGLAIVVALADQVGYEGSGEHGHRVWARLS
ncbi:ATP-binding protein [Sphaerisporangium sp. NPDC051017]|uniref:ATP-binding protein n=1 Tax=Sphaerisporangium sp. NPDC051017 TaxID=3154636 RepID=UPI00341A223A